MQSSAQSKQVSRIAIVQQRRQARFFVERLRAGVELEMVEVPAGSFLMGAAKEEAGSSEDERPQHPVTVLSFCMGKYPVTQAQWRVVATDIRQVSQELNPQPSRFEGDNRPVEQVSWYDAVEFCDRLSQHTGKSYRLPSEAEWEYACRAGTTTPFHFGETITPDLANYWTEKAYRNAPTQKNRGEITPVGSFGVANAFGLYDMHGNVREWCLDHWHENYQGAPIDGSTWLSENENAYRLLRGGSWVNDPEGCRSAYRSWFNPVDGGSVIGFRVVCSLARTL